MKILEGEVGLNNTSGLHSGPEDILLRGDVTRDCYPVEIIQVARNKRRTRRHERNALCVCTTHAKAEVLLHVSTHIHVICIVVHLNKMDLNLDGDL